MSELSTTIEIEGASLFLAKAENGIVITAADPKTGKSKTYAFLSVESAIAWVQKFLANPAETLA